MRPILAVRSQGLCGKVSRFAGSEGDSGQVGARTGSTRGRSRVVMNIRNRWHRHEGVGGVDVVVKRGPVSPFPKLSTYTAGRSEI